MQFYKKKSVLCKHTLFLNLHPTYFLLVVFAVAVFVVIVVFVAVAVFWAVVVFAEPDLQEEVFVEEQEQDFVP